MRLKWILVFFSTVVLLPVLLIALALLFLHVADLGKHRDAIALQLSSLAGRSITLDGAIDIDLSMTPSLLITDIAVANAAWGSEPQMLTVQRVEGEIDLLPLLNGRIHIPRLHVTGVSSLVETDEDGTGNWVFADPGRADAADPDEAAPAGFKRPWLGDLNIADVGIVYRNAQSGQRVEPGWNTPAWVRTAPNRRQHSTSSAM